jgi:hypothetical protein
MESRWYYTRLDTAKSILAGGALWATNALYLNDPGEHRYGLRVLLAWLRRLARDPSGRAAAHDWIQVLEPELLSLDVKPSQWFVICFSSIDPTTPEALSQWTRYSGENGVCLEFDLGGCSDLGAYGPDNPCLFTWGDSGDPVERDDRKAVAYPVETVNYWPEDGLVDALRLEHLSRPQAAIYIKHPAFTAEREGRLAFCVPNLARFGAVKTAIRHEVCVPYLDIRVGPTEDNPEGLGWPVKSVTVGPGRRQDQVFRSLRTMLDAEQPFFVRKNPGRLDPMAAAQDVQRLWQADLAQRLAGVDATDETRQSADRVATWFIQECLATDMGSNYDDHVENLGKLLGREVIQTLAERFKDWQAEADTQDAQADGHARDSRADAETLQQEVEADAVCVEELVRFLNRGGVLELLRRHSLTRDGIKLLRSDAPYSF